MLKGYLRGKGLRVQWERVRQSLLRTDPSGVHQRWSESIRRRKYWVPGPLALWHIDGNHKLIRYKFCLLTVNVLVTSNFGIVLQVVMIRSKKNHSCTRLCTVKLRMCGSKKYPYSPHWKFQFNVSPPPQNFQYPSWSRYGYFLEQHNTVNT